MTTNSNQNPYVRTGGWEKTDTQCKCGKERATVYLNHLGALTALGENCRKALLAGERQLALVEKREPRFIALVPVWSLNMATAIATGEQFPEQNRLGKDRDGRLCKLCACRGCNHPAGNKGIPRNGIAHLFCGGCGAALEIVAERKKLPDLKPMSAEEARQEAAKQRDANLGIATELLGTTTGTTIKVNSAGKLVMPLAVLTGVTAPKADPKPEGKPSRQNGKKARKRLEADRAEFAVLVEKHGLAVEEFESAYQRALKNGTKLANEIAATDAGKDALAEYDAQRLKAAAAKQPIADAATVEAVAN